MIRKLLAVAASVLLLAISPVAAGSASSGAGPAWPDPWEANALIGRGVNLVVPWEFYGRHGFDALDPDVGAQGAVDSGFDSIHYFVDLGGAAGPAPGYDLPPGLVDEVRARIEAGTSRGLTVIINYDGSIVDVERFAGVWRSAAAELGDLAPNVFFELANEPLWHHVPGELPDFSEANVVNASDWNELVAAAVSAIRESDPHRTIVVTSAHISFPQALPSLVLPDDDNLVATFHQYQPLDVTSFEPFRPWTGTPDEIESMKGTMNDAVCWARVNDVPVWMSEFGVAQFNDEASRVAWTTTVARLAEAEGMSWSYFWLSGVVGVWDDDTGEWYEPLYRSLVPADDSGALDPWADCPDAPGRSSDSPTAPSQGVTPATAAEAVSTVTPRFTG